MKTRMLFLASIIVGIIAINSAFAQQWTQTLIFSENQAIKDSLLFGIDPSGTDGIDATLGEVEQPPKPFAGVFDIRFTGTGLGNGLKRDIRLASTDTKEYTIDIQRAAAGEISISWRTLQAGTFVMQDLFGGIIFNVDMTTTNQATITNVNVTQIKLIVTPVLDSTVEIISDPDSTQAVTLTDDNATVDVTYTDSSSVNISFTSGTVTGQTLTIEKLSSIPDEAVNNQQFSNTVGIYDISLNVSSFSADLTFGYSDSILNASSILEDNLGASFYDSTDARGFIWHSVPVTLDKNNNTIKITTSHFSLWALMDINDALVTDVEEEEFAIIPTRFEFMQNYPNPFNPSTTIKFDIPKSTRVRILIYNTLGQIVKDLVNEDREAGFHEVVWDGRNSLGVQVSSGMYIYRIVTGEFSMSKKMVLIR